MKTLKLNQTVETIKIVSFFVVLAALAVVTVLQVIGYETLGRI